MGRTTRSGPQLSTVASLGRAKLIAISLGSLILLAAVLALVMHRSSKAPPQAGDKSLLTGSPLVEGQSIETLFGLHRGLMRHQLKKRSKPFRGRVLRISGIVQEVQSPTHDIKYAALRGGYSRSLSGITLMFRVQFEPDFTKLAPGRAIRAACVFRGEINPDSIRFEDCRFTP